MKKEKHVLKNPYNHHALSRYIDVYEVTTDGCSSSPMSGYKGTEATLIDQPAWNEKFSSYSITGATVTGNNFILNNDVTAKANYETAKNLTLQTDGHGSIAANRNSGFIGDQVTLSNTAATNYSFSGYTITGATLTGNKFNFTGSNVTAKAWYTKIPTYTSMPIAGAMLGVADSITASEYAPDHSYQRVYYDYNQTHFTRAIPGGNPSTINLNVFANGYSVNSIRNMSAYSTNFVTGKDVLMTTYTNKYIKLTGSQSAIITSIYVDFSGTFTGTSTAGFNSLYFFANNTSAKPNYSTASSKVTAYKTLVFNTPFILTAGEHYLTFGADEPGGAYPNPLTADFTAQKITWNGYISGQV